MQQEFSYEKAFSRNIGVLTEEAQELLKKSCVAIAGVGGVGGTTSEQLARMGIGYLKLADHDNFEMSNLNRQTGSSMAALGKNKAATVNDYLKDINPEIKIDVFAEGVKESNLDEFVKDADIVVDLVDYFSPAARLAIHRKARAGNKYVLSTPSTGFGAAVMCFAPDGLSLEDFLGFPHEEEKIKTHRMDPEKLMGCRLDYLPNLYWQNLQGTSPYVSTVSPAVAIAGCLTATQAVKLLMYQEQQKDFFKFREYGKIEITTVPEVLRIDAWDAKHCCTTDFGKKR
jgi:molybdopterin/thiamine biosynthesis adenylyltransferase